MTKFICPRCLYSTDKKCNIISHIQRVKLCHNNYIDLVPIHYKSFVLREENYDIELLKEIVNIKSQQNNKISQTNLFPYDDPDDSYITYNKIILQHDKPRDIFIDIFKQIYCNMQQIQNHSMIKTNLNNPYIKIFNGKEWIMATRNIFKQVLENIQLLLITSLQEKGNTEELQARVEKIQQMKIDKPLINILTAILYNFTKQNNFQ